MNEAAAPPSVAAVEARLVRGIRPIDIAALVVNVTVGAGILGLPGHVYGLVGGWSLLLVAGVAALIAIFALVFAELSGRFEQTGGPFLYFTAAFGPTPGFVIGWLMWVTRALSIPTQLNLLLEYAAGPFPALGEGPGRIAAIVAVVGGYTAVLLSGVTASARISTAFTALKLALFAVFIAAAIGALDPGRFALDVAPRGEAISDAVLLLIFAFVGFESVTIVAGETQSPRRALPLGLLAGMAVVAVVYVLVLAVTVSLLPDPAAPERAVAAAAEALAGPVGGAAATAGVAVILLGAMSAGFLLTSRLLFALAEHRQLPGLLAWVSPRRRTPDAAILASAVAILLFTVFNSFLSALVLATAVRLVTYAACCVAMLQLRRTSPEPSAFRAPAGGLLAVAGVALAAAILLVSALEQLLVTAVVALVGLGLMLLTRLARRRRQP
jgi:amino acid transporter